MHHQNQLEQMANGAMFATPGFKHMARYTLHCTKPSGARADMREAAKREGKGVEKVSDEKMW
jgi:hypothetical protein